MKRNMSKKGYGPYGIMLKLAFIVIFLLFLGIFALNAKDRIIGESEKFNPLNLLEAAEEEQIDYLNKEFGPGVGEYVTAVAAAFKAEPITSKGTFYTFDAVDQDTYFAFHNEHGTFNDDKTDNEIELEIATRGDILDIYVVNKETGRQDLVASGEEETSLRRKLCMLPAELGGADLRIITSALTGLNTQYPTEGNYDIDAILERNVITRLIITPEKDITATDGDYYLKATYFVNGEKKEKLLGDGVAGAAGIGMNLFGTNCPNCKYLVASYKEYVCLVDIEIAVPIGSREYIDFESGTEDSNNPTLVGEGALEKEVVEYLVANNIAREPPKATV